MSEKVRVVSFKETGHVLGVLGRSGDPQGTITMEMDELIGEGLPLRDPKSGKNLITVETLHASATTLDLPADLDLYINMSRYGIVDDALTPFDLAIINTSVKLESTKVSFDLVAVPSEALPVWVQVEGIPGPGPERFYGNFDIPANQPVGTVDIPITGTLAPGDYQVFVFARSYQVASVQLTLP